MEALQRKQTKDNKQYFEPFISLQSCSIIAIQIQQI